ncbi:putative bacterial surface antigen (D15), surface antigen D15 [Helianthus anomalus]
MICAVYHRNLFGRNQKINLSLERGQIDSIFRINYTDPWIEGDDKRTSRTIMIQAPIQF